MKNGDKQFVVVKNGQRISDLHPDEQAALAEAAEQRKLCEDRGPEGRKEAATVMVKQNLLG